MAAIRNPEDIPYLTYVPEDGRSVPFVVSNIGEKWYFCGPDGDKALVAELGGITSATYLKIGPPAESSDLHLTLGEMIVQHFSYSDTLRHLTGIEYDLLNGLGSIHKYFILANYANNSEHAFSMTLISTEIEYALNNHRSFYDLLNDVLVSIYEKQPLFTSDGKLLKPNSIPRSFGKMAEKTEDELRNKFHLPPPIIDFYRQRAKNFLPCRVVRDNIVHHGHTMDSGLPLPHGFALRVTGASWEQLSELGIWDNKIFSQPNELACVLALMAWLVGDMVSAMNALADAAQRSFIPLPRPVADGCHFYLRDPMLYHLGRVGEYQTKLWFYPAQILAEYNHLANSTYARLSMRQ